MLRQTNACNYIFYSKSIARHLITMSLVKNAPIPPSKKKDTVCTFFFFPPLGNYEKLISFEWNGSELNLFAFVLRT